MPSEQFAATVELVAASGLGEAASVDERRATIDGLGQILPVAEGTGCEPVDADGVPAAWVTPAGWDTATAHNAVMWLHGGGYNIGSLISHRALTSHLASRLGCGVLAVDYRLAPEHRYPAALEDAATAWQWLVASGFDPAAVGVGGDSAGGGLAVSLAMSLQSAGGPLPAALALLCPWVDLTGNHPVPDERVAADVVLSPDLLAGWAAAYAGDTERDDPGVSPLFGSFEGLPPMFIQAGGRDMIVDDATRLADRASAAGCAVELHVEPDMIHAWQLFAGAFPEAGAALDAAAGWLSDQLGN